MADNNKAATTLVCETQEALYQKAIKKMEADKLIVQFAYKIENYKTAAAMFDEVGDYLDAPELAAKCRELAAQTRKEELADHYQRALESEERAETEQEYERVAEAFGVLDDYCDAPEKRQQCLDFIGKIQKKRKRKIMIAVLVLVLCAGAVTAGFATGFFRYLVGIGYYHMEMYERAEKAFEVTGGLLDSDAWADRCRAQLESQELAEERAALRNAKEGDTVAFGAYTWRVLERQGDEVLLILNNVKEDSAFYHVPYNNTQKTVAWEESSLFERLNGETLDAEFTPQEKESLLSVGKNGQDAEAYIRILNLEEAEKYKDILKKMSGLDYWLSSPGVQEGTAAFVSGGGEIMDYGYPMNCENISVRPVIKINCVEAAEEETR